MKGLFRYLLSWTSTVNTKPPRKFLNKHQRSARIMIDDSDSPWGGRRIDIYTLDVKCKGYSRVVARVEV